MDNFLNNKNLGLSCGRKTLLNFKIDDKIKIMIKPIQSNIKSTSAAALSERSVSFETWRHFVIELFKLNRLIYPNVLGK